MEGLENGAGGWVTEEEEMGQIVEAYFQGLFASNNQQESENLQEFLAHVPQCVGREENELLRRPFTKEEVLGSLKQMGPSKAPGEDGLPALFY